MSTNERHRKELADLLDRDPETLADGTALLAELALDSLAMMNVLAWLHGHGVVLDLRQRRPATVGELLSLADKPATLQINVTAPNGERLGPAQIPPPAQAPADPLVPVLVDHMVRLTPVVPDDLGFLYDLTVRPENCFRWRYRGAPPQVERFAESIWHGVMVQFVVRSASDGEPLGHVVAYQAHPALHYAYVGAVFLPEHTGTGLGPHAVSLFIKYLFHTFPFKKLYLEVPGFNWDQVRSGEGRVFTVEGVLRDHSFYAGRNWDEYLCAIYR